jgi:hypothetical protein
MDDQVTVTLRAPDRAVLLAQLMQGENKLDEAFTFLQRRNGSYNIQAIVPQSGRYVLRLFAKNLDDEGSYSWALDYSLTASEGKSGGFPRVFSTFSENGGYLHSPMSGRLKRGSTQTFKIQVQGAEKVAVIVGDNWHDLNKEGDLFTGDVTINDKNIRVFAKSPGREQYDGLLEYTAF